MSRTQLRHGRFIASICAGLAALTFTGSAFAEPWAGDVTGETPWTTATGDFDNDNQRDLVFGFPKRSGNGLVGIWINDGDPRHSAVENGSNSGAAYFNLVQNNFLTIFPASPVMQGSPVYNQAQPLFGASVVTGDFDNDGKDDIAFGAPGATINGRSNAGAVVVIYGKDLGNPNANIPPTPGAAATFTQDSPGVGSSAETNDYFGEVLAVGDFDCNGVDDLAIGVPREDIGYSAPDAGYVHVLYGQTNSGLTGVGSSTLWQGGGPLSDTYEANDHFGAALAGGAFAPSSYLGQRWCDSLAIGVPGEDFTYNYQTRVDAGRVHLIIAPSYAQGGYFTGFKPITEGFEFLLDQSTNGVYSSPENNDTFGSALGRVTGSRAARGSPTPFIDALWIAAAGESCNNCVDGVVHRLDWYLGSSWTGSSVRPDILETETGVVVEKGDQFGRWLQYIPEGIDPQTAEMFVVSPGTNKYTSSESAAWPAGRANANRYMAYDGFVQAADDLGFVLIIPEWEDYNFGNDFQPNFNAGGYRALLGRDIRADWWIDRIVDRYANVGLGDGRMHLFGHSAGGQFAIRYALQRPERMLNVIVESSGSMPRPTIDENPNDGIEPTPSPWRGGFGNIWLPAANGWPALVFFPNEAGAAWAAANRPISIVAGSLEGASHTDVVMDWMDDVATTWGPHQMTYCEVQGVDHDSKSAHRSALKTVWPSLSFPGAPACN